MKGLVQIMEETKKELVVEATLDNLDKVLQFVESEAKIVGCPEKAVGQIVVSVEELYVNIASYAYAPDIGNCVIQLWSKVQNDSGRLRIQIKDNGKKFNPLTHKPPDITLSADERQIGGLGILMAGKLMDKLVYSYENGQNILLVEKHW